MFYIIGTEECEYCTLAKEFLTEERVPFIFYKAETDEELQDLKKHWSHPTVPIILFITPHGIEYVGGYDDLSSRFKILQETYGFSGEPLDVRGGHSRRDSTGC
jgi:glutaredoxin